MQSIVVFIGVFSCLASLTPAIAEITSSSATATASASASTSSSSSSSASQTAYMELVYNETSCGRELAGGYWPVEDLTSSDLKAYSALALANYTKDNDEDFLVACQPNIAAAKNSIRVDAACQQVVAGTNYIIAFHVEFPCRASGMPQTIDKELLANVFVPLPMSNDAPQVTSVVAIED